MNAFQMDMAATKTGSNLMNFTKKPSHNKTVIARSYLNRDRVSSPWLLPKAAVADFCLRNRSFVRRSENIVLRRSLIFVWRRRNQCSKHQSLGSGNLGSRIIASRLVLRAPIPPSPNENRTLAENDILTPPNKTPTPETEIRYRGVRKLPWG
ncbi:hypothetical protein TSUD_242360 [Trifolium subterraneum]|uniref:Uncharacterized protein n=1 Tax=Trifolium subterraneum TaxID=3900 RepID=A0A2Z6PCF8_TRISU|nr:hypothetical protein TSUD_242360 [Trifolium subterraneum]